MKSSSFLVKVGSVTVPVYTGQRSGRPRFTVCHYAPSGKRVRQEFTDETKARKEAERLARAVTKGTTASDLSSSDVDIYKRALAMLAPSGGTLLEAVAEFVRRHPTNLERRTVKQVVAEHAEDLVQRGLSEGHRELSAIVGKAFTEAFDVPIAQVTPQAFRTWLYAQTSKRDGQLLSNRTRLNLQRGFGALVNFAARRKYLSREAAAEFSEMEAPKAAPPTCAVFTADQFGRLLTAAGDDSRAAFVLGGFCGLRTAEIFRVHWEDIRLAEGVVIVGAHIAKTAGRRVVPLCPAAVAWLTPLAKTSGMALTVLDREMVRVGVRAGVPWVKNGLRHGFCSARLAVTADAAKTASEAGNSPGIIQKHYRSLMTAAEGAAWFDLTPKTPANVAVVNFQGAEAAA